MVLLTISTGRGQITMSYLSFKRYFKGLLSTVQVDSKNSQCQLRALESEETMRAFLGLEVGLLRVEEEMAANLVTELKCW